MKCYIIYLYSLQLISIFNSDKSTSQFVRIYIDSSNEFLLNVHNVMQNSTVSVHGFNYNFDCISTFRSF